MKIFKIVFTIYLLCNLTACINYDFTHGKYQQGNLLKEKAIAHVKIGMTKDEVASIMGASLLNDTFNQNHWDYAYTIRVGSGPSTIKHLVINFKNGRVVNISQQ